MTQTCNYGHTCKVCIYFMKLVKLWRSVDFLGCVDFVCRLVVAAYSTQDFASCSWRASKNSKINDNEKVTLQCWRQCCPLEKIGAVPRVGCVDQRQSKHINRRNESVTKTQNWRKKVLFVNSLIMHRFEIFAQSIATDNTNGYKDNAKSVWLVILELRSLSVDVKQEETR